MILKVIHIGHKDRIKIGNKVLHKNKIIVGIVKDNDLLDSNLLIIDFGDGPTKIQKELLMLIITD